MFNTFISTQLHGQVNKQHEVKTKISNFKITEVRSSHFKIHTKHSCIFSAIKPVKYIISTKDNVRIEGHINDKNPLTYSDINQNNYMVDIFGDDGEKVDVHVTVHESQYCHEIELKSGLSFSISTKTIEDQFELVDDTKKIENGFELVDDIKIIEDRVKLGDNTKTTEEFVFVQIADICRL